MVEQVGADTGLDGGDPGEVGQDETLVELADVVGEEVDELADGGVSEGGFVEAQDLAVDEGAARHSHFHGEVDETHHGTVGHEGVGEATEDDDGGVDVGLGFGDQGLAGLKVGDEFADGQGHCHAGRRRLMRVRGRWRFV